MPYLFNSSFSPVTCSLSFSSPKGLSALSTNMRAQMIMGAIKEKGALTIREISKMTGIQPNLILRHIIALRKSGIISEVGEKEDGYLYTVVR